MPTKSLLLSGPLQTERMKDGRRRLLRDLVIRIEGDDFTIPERTLTDYSSIPWYGRFLVRWSKVDIAGVVHDWLYQTGKTSRLRADKMWRLVAQAGDQRANAIQAWIGWAALRLGARSVWYCYRRCDRRGASLAAPESNRHPEVPADNHTGTSVVDEPVVDSPEITSRSQQTKTTSERWAWIAIAVAVLCVVFGGVVTYYSYAAAGGDWSQAGTRGDFWGGHASAATGFAGTLLLFAAFWFQRIELQLQRQELADGRIIALKQACALEEQKKELQIQNMMAGRRDDTDLVLRLAANAADCAIKSGVESALPSIRLAFVRVAERCSSDRRMALDLLYVFIGTLRWTHNLGALISCWDEALHQVRPDGRFDKDWRDHAERIIDAHYEWRR